MESIQNALTISDSRARAGSSVDGASLWRSTASRTSTKRHRGSLAGYLSILTSSTVSCASDSQRRGTSSHCSASATAPMMRSNRCRPVMHCTELTTAAWSPPACGCVDMCATSRSRSCSTMADFPVAEVPWTTRLRHGAASGWLLVGG